jgi:hypothetical protein
VQCTWLPNFHVLITDQANERVIEVTLDHRIVWQYGMTGVASNGFDQLNNPNSAELLENGHILIADENNSRAIEVTRDHQIVKTFSATNSVNILAFASRLPNGDTLLTDSGNARIVEVNSSDIPVWQYFTDTDTDSVAAPLPTRAVRLKNGDTLISDQFNNRVIRVNMAKTIVMTYGLSLPPGGATFPNLGSGVLIGTNIGYDLHTTQNGLYSPYDAKIIGDYTGLTPPFDFDDDADNQ